MTGDDAGRGRQRLRALGRTLTLRQAMIAVASVVVLASGLFGGLATATPDGPAELAAGESIAVTPFDLTVERVRWLTDLGDGQADPDVRYVGVVATIENTSDHPVYAADVRRVVRLVDVDGIMKDDEIVASAEVDPDVTVLADSTTLNTAPPGLAFEVVLLWRQSTTVDPPTEVAVSARTQTWRQSSLDDQYRWFDATVTHQGSFEVREGGS